MSVKFRIGLTVGAETLFGMLAKMLPIEDLSVEELLAEKPKALFLKSAETMAPKPKIRPKRQRPSRGPLLTAGINAIIIAALQEGPKRAVDLKPKLQEGGYSPSSTGSRLQELQSYKAIERMSDGRWRLVSKDQIA